jgi:hypothetical protein
LSEKQSPEHRLAWLEVLRRSLSTRGIAEQLAIPVRVEVGERGWYVIEQAGLRDSVQRQAADSVQYQLRGLGIPGWPKVEIRANPNSAYEFRLLVHDRPARLPGDQVGEIIRRLAGPECHSFAELQADHIGPGVAGLCTAALHRRPSLLLEEKQTGFYADTLGRVDIAQPGLGWPPAIPWLHEVLIPVLDAGVSIGDTGTVASILAAGQLDAVPPAFIAERIIDQLRLNAVHIRLNGQTLRWLTTQEIGPTAVFTDVREKLYAESGALFPDFKFVEDAELPSQTVAFGMNGLTTLPVKLPDSHPIQAVAAYLESELRAHRGWFMSISVTEERFTQLSFACPDLVGAILDSYPMEWITAVGRSLFREEIPTQSLKTILEHALDFGNVGEATDVVRMNASAAVAAKPAIESLPEPRDVVSYLRQRSSEMLQDSRLIEQHGKVFLLGGKLHDMAASLQAMTEPLDNRQAEIISDAVRHQITNAAGNASLAVKSVPVRSFVRELLEPEFPLIPVVATQEFGVLQVRLFGGATEPTTDNIVD